MKSIILQDMDRYQTISILSGDFGDEGIHRHRIPVEADDPHTYQMVTRAAQARA